jgi:hypothetical protein
MFNNKIYDLKKKIDIKAYKKDRKKWDKRKGRWYVRGKVYGNLKFPVKMDKIYDPLQKKEVDLKMNQKLNILQTYLIKSRERIKKVFKKKININNMLSNLI